MKARIYVKEKQERAKARLLFDLAELLETKKANFYKQAPGQQNMSQLAQDMNRIVRAELMDNPQLRSPV